MSIHTARALLATGIRCRTMPTAIVQALAGPAAAVVAVLTMVSI